MGLTNAPSDLLPGTLELLILKALSHGTKHGYGIVEHLRLTSADVLQVGESALYPALHRLERRGLLTSRWSELNGRRRRIYQVTQKGHRALAKQHGEWRAFARAVEAVVAGLA